MELHKRAEELIGAKLDRVRIVTDTTDFTQINRGDVLDLEGHLFVIRGVTFEGRFGLDEEPKHWVKTAVDMHTGAAKIIKLVFYEDFTLPVGNVMIRRYRSPRKESRILQIVRGHPHFMQGITYYDAAENPVRVLDRIPGVPFEVNLMELRMDHQTYFQTRLSGVLDKLVPAIKAMAFLHQSGERHGDIRRDHLFVQGPGQPWAWIDFDYNYDMGENPFGFDLFGLGNVICHAVGAGIPTLHDLRRDQPEIVDILEYGDMSPVITNRVFNLRKLYPYIPEKMNNVLMHFATSSPVFYETVDELLEDLEPAMRELPPAPKEDKA